MFFSSLLLANDATCLPHFPWEPTPRSKEQGYRKAVIGKKGDPCYFPDMVAYLDQQIGTMLATLDELGIAQNTIVILLADHGTDRDLTNQWGDGKSIAGGKGTLTDRGTHVPLIVRWPDRLKAGNTCDDLIDLTDFLPTLCELSGAALPPRAFTAAAVRQTIPAARVDPHPTRKQPSSSQSQPHNQSKK